MQMPDCTGQGYSQVHDSAQNWIPGIEQLTWGLRQAVGSWECWAVRGCSSWLSLSARQQQMVAVLILNRGLGAAHAVE